jgi:hypothetical protein
MSTKARHALLFEAMGNFKADDLRYAQTVGVAVRLNLFNGQELLVGVHEVNEVEGFVSLYDPQGFGDSTTTRKVGLEDITSVTVTDIEWTT